jgi:hypothetical protein
MYATPTPRFIGGLTGRSGTGWLARLIGERGDVCVITEIGLFNHAQFRGAPEEFWSFASQTPAGRRAYLAYLRRFLLRTAYDAKRSLPHGPRGLIELVPRAAIKDSFVHLEHRWQDATSIDEVYLALGEFYAAMFSFHAHVTGRHAAWLSKEPIYGAAARTLLRLFPEMRLVVMARDGRDVALSMYSRGWFGSIRASIDAWVVSARRALAALDSLPPAAARLVRYEDLVLRNEETVSDLLEFWDLPRTKESPQTDRLVPDSSSIGGWEQAFDKDDRGHFAAEARALNQRLGYPE